MVHQLTETHAEGTDRSRHQDISARSCLCATLQSTVVQGTHLIGMVGEVGVRACVIERELTTDQQRALMVRGTEGSAEGGTGLTIRHKRVGEEQAGLSRKTVCHLTGLTHETVLHLHRVVDRATVTDDRVLTDHTRTNEYWGIHRTHHRTLRESCSTTDLTVTLDNRVGDILRIDDLHIITDKATLGTRHTQLILNHLLQGFLQHLVTVMLHHESSQLTVQLTEDGHVAVTHLVEHRDHAALTKGGIIRRLQRTDVRDITVVTDGIVVDIVTHFLNQTVVTHRHIPQCSVVDARVLREALGHLHHLLEGTETDIPIEHHTMEVIGSEFLSHHHSLPVLCPADIIFQDFNLCLC